MSENLPWYRWDRNREQRLWRFCWKWFRWTLFGFRQRLETVGFWGALVIAALSRIAPILGIDLAHINESLVLYISLCVVGVIAIFRAIIFPVNAYFEADARASVTTVPVAGSEQDRLRDDLRLLVARLARFVEERKRQSAQPINYEKQMAAAELAEKFGEIGAVWNLEQSIKAAAAAHNSLAMDAYDRDFGKRVIEIERQLRKHHITDKRIRRYPKRISDIENIVAAIDEAIKRIPDNDTKPASIAPNGPRLTLQWLSDTPNAGPYRPIRIHNDSDHVAYHIKAMVPLEDTPYTIKIARDERVGREPVDLTPTLYLGTTPYTPASRDEVIRFFREAIGISSPAWREVERQRKVLEQYTKAAMGAFYEPPPDLVTRFTLTCTDFDGVEYPTPQELMYFDSSGEILIRLATDDTLATDSPVEDDPDDDSVS